MSTNNRRASHVFRLITRHLRMDRVDGAANRVVSILAPDPEGAIVVTYERPIGGPLQSVRIVDGIFTDVACQGPLDTLHSIIPTFIEKSI